MEAARTPRDRTAKRGVRRRIKTGRDALCRNRCMLLWALWLPAKSQCQNDGLAKPQPTIEPMTLDSQLIVANQTLGDRAREFPNHFETNYVRKDSGFSRTCGRISFTSKIGPIENKVKRLASIFRLPDPQSKYRISKKAFHTVLWGRNQTWRSKTSAASRTMRARAENDGVHLPSVCVDA